MFRLHVYGIYPVSDKNPAQSGRLDYVKEVADPAGITPNWQPIDGGFAYQTADGKVKMLLGAAAGEIDDRARRPAISHGYRMHIAKNPLWRARFGGGDPGCATWHTPPIRIDFS